MRKEVMQFGKNLVKSIPIIHPKKLHLMVKGNYEVLSFNQLRMAWIAGAENYR